jgi:hypothetical protein
VQSNVAQGTVGTVSPRAPAQETSAGTSRWHSFVEDRDLWSPRWLIPFAIAAAYLVLFALQFPKIIELATWDSDIASAFTIPATLVQTGTGGHTELGSSGAYVELWFGLLTAWLPFHRLLWEIAASAAFLATALTIGWSVSRVATRRAAALAVLLAFVISTPAFTIFTAAAAHNTVYLGTALLGAYLVWMARSSAPSRAVSIAIPLLAGVALGVFFASDLLLLVTGIVPFAFTAALLSLQRDRRSRSLAITALATMLVAAPCAWITSSIMGSLGFAIERPSTKIAPLSELSRHSKYLFEGLKELFGGYLGDQKAPGTLQSITGTAADIAMIAALLMLLAFGGYTLVRFLRSTLPRRSEEADPRNFARIAHIVYWTGSAVSTAVAFELSANADAPRPQYYATLIFSVAAIAPLLTRSASARPARLASVGSWLVPLGASIFFIAAIVGLTGSNFDVGLFRRDQQSIVKLAQTNHATTGYAGYWYASNLTWNSHERVKVRPLSLCENPAGADICPFYVNRVPSWYAPTQRRSFLLVNPNEEFLYVVPPGLGQPVAAYVFPDATRMYIYPYDIASRLGAPPNP